MDHLYPLITPKLVCACGFLCGISTLNFIDCNQGLLKNTSPQVIRGHPNSLHYMSISIPNVQ
jgi:hypothetical protein